MEISLLMQLPIAAIAAILLYTFIGFIPGTDETSVLVPVTLALVLAGVSPIVVLTFFIAAIVTLNLTNAIPTALVGLPGGVLSTPMMEHSLYLKEKGRAAETIKKMAAGSGIGTLVSIPVSLAIATAITPYAETLREYIEAHGAQSAAEGLRNLLALQQSLMTDMLHRRDDAATHLRAGRKSVRAAHAYQQAESLG